MYSYSQQDRQDEFEYEIRQRAVRGDVDGLVHLGIDRYDAEELCCEMFNQMAQRASMLMHGTSYR